MRLPVSPSWRPPGRLHSPMLIARTIFLLLGVAAIVSFAMYIGTGEPRFRRYGLVIVKWAVFAGLAFFAVLALEHLAVMF